MNDAVALPALRPDQQKNILPLRNGMDTRYRLVRGIDIMPVHLHDHISGLQTGIFRWAARTNASNGRSLHPIREIELLPHIGCQV